MISLTRFVNEKFNSVLYTDMRLVLEGDMLVKTDRMSMANSLEVRVPFLAPQLVNLVMTLPPEFKIGKKQGKRILRETFAPLLPREVLSRKKQGFEIPLHSLLKQELRPMIASLLGKERIREQGIFNPAEMQTLADLALSGNPGDAPSRVWGLLVFQFWWDKYMKR
jgi:asparagine synthase (glutamine-hydrolysing)